MATVATYTPPNINAGSGEIRSIPVLLKANSGAVGAYAPLCFETTNYKAEKVDALADKANFIGFLAPIDPSNAAGVTADANGFFGLADSAAERLVQVIVSGDFWDDVIPWPGAFTTIGHKQFLIANSGLTIQAAKTGQV